MFKNKYLKCFTSTLNENVCIKAYPECRKNDKESLYFRLIHKNSHEFRSSHQSHVLLSVNIRQIFVRTSRHVTASRPQESKPADNIVHYWMYPSSRHKNNSKSTFSREKGLWRGTWQRKMAAKGVVTSDLYKRLNSASII